MERENLNLFKDAVAFIKDCRINKKGGFVIRQNEFGFKLLEPYSHPVIAKHGDKISPYIGEVTQLTLHVLNKKDEEIIIQAKKQSEKDSEILQKKLDLIKQEIITEKLTKTYLFITNCTTNILKELSLQIVIKPSDSDLPDLISIIARIDIDNNKAEPKEESIIFEMSPELLDDVIKSFLSFKQKLLRLEGAHDAEGKIESKKTNELL